MPNRNRRSSRADLLEARARGMRRQLTPSERVLWQVLRGQRLDVAFRRQAIVLDRFVVDFLAPKIRLVFEVDGDYHVSRKRADARRDALLERAGYRMLRLDAELVLRELERALEMVRETIGRG